MKNLKQYSILILIIVIPTVVGTICKCTGQGNQYKCEDGKIGYCGAKQECFNSEGFAYGQFKDACRIKCKCTGQGNQYKCDDGTSGYCGNQQGCYNKIGFTKGKLDQACGVTCRCTGEGNKYTCSDGTEGYCASGQQCWNKEGFLKGNWCKGCKYEFEVAPCSTVPGPRCICADNTSVRCDGDTWNRQCKDLLGSFLTKKEVENAGDNVECYAKGAFPFQEWCKACRPKGYEYDPCLATLCKCSKPKNGVIDAFSCGTGSSTTTHSCSYLMKFEALHGMESPYNFVECFNQNPWSVRKTSPQYCNGCRNFRDRSPCRVNKKEVFDEDDIEWANEWDKELSFECGSGQHVTEIYSIFSGYRKDRRWNFKCSNGVVSDACTWSEKTYVKGNIDFNCPDNYVLSGLQSKHQSEDRIWKFKCCMANSYQTSKDNCWSYKLNYWGTTDLNKSNKIGYKVHAGTVITSLKAERFDIKKTEENNDKHEKDRQWTIKTCSLVTCKVNNVKVTGAAGATKSDTKIVAIGSMVGCNPDVGYGFELSKENTVTESKSITVGNSKTFEWEHEVSVTAGFAIEGEVAEIEVTATASGSTGSSTTFSEENTKSVASTSGSSAAKGLEMNGPGVLIGWATMDMYEWSQSNVAAEFIGQCQSYNPDGTVAEKWPYKIQGGVSLAGRSFGNTQFYLRSSDLDGDASKCTPELSDCIQNIGAQNLLNSETIDDQLKGCLKGVNATQIVARSLKNTSKLEN